MFSQRGTLQPLIIVGVISFMFASVPDTLGRETIRDRPTTEGAISEMRSDARIAKEIRASLARDAELSLAAKKVKVVTNKGSVFLRGTVASEAEKARVVEIAKGIARTKLVDNDLEIRAQ